MPPAKNGRLSDLDRAADGLNRFYLWRRRFNDAQSAARLAQETLLLSLSASAKDADAAQTNRIAAKIQTWQSIFVEREKANDLVEQALHVLDSPQLAPVDTRRERAFALQRAGDLAFDIDGQEARRHYRQSLALYRELGDTWAAAKLSTALGWVAAHNDDMEEARQLGQEALDLVRAAGDRKRTADALWLLGTLAILEDQVEESSRLLGESLDIRQTLGDRITDIAAGPLDLGMTLTWIGRMAEADAVREETLALYQAQGQPEQIALAHVRLATSKMHIGQLAASERYARTGLRLCREVGNQRGAGLALWLLAMLCTISREAEQAESLLRESLAIFRNIEGAFELGWALGLYADVARQLGKPAVARKYIQESLCVASRVLGLITILTALLSYVNLLADEGRHERAFEMSALLEKHPFMREGRAGKLVYSKRLAEIKAALPPQVVARAQARGRARDLQETAAEILAELEDMALADTATTAVPPPLSTA